MVSVARAQQIATEILSQRFGKENFLSADVVPDEDYSGAPILRVSAHFGKPLAEFEGLLDSVNAIRDRLIEEGDERYVLITPEWLGSEDEGDSDDENDPEREFRQ
ncbi:MAG: hypothetical protein ACK5JM_05510 [Rhodoblastus sp.]